MSELLSSLRLQLTRQVEHWLTATSRLERPENFASPSAWEGLELYMGVKLRGAMAASVARLERQGAALRAQLRAAQTTEDFARLQRELVSFRNVYLQTEVMLDFYGDAINTRTYPQLAALLRACDTLAGYCMAGVLEPLKKPIPPVLTYVDKGLGASILKSGLRLWDGSISPCAAIKIVRHNLLRPTALIHEAGHQVAHISGWTDELAKVFEEKLASDTRDVARMWAGWISEVTADAFAFAHTGYAAVAALHDVLAGDDAFVFRLVPGDPHPVSFIRVLLGVEMCRQFYGPGPWDDLAHAWTHSHRLENATAETRNLLRASLAVLPRVVDLSVRAPLRAFAGRRLVDFVDPARVKPQALLELEQKIGVALYTSHHWVRAESVRLLALSGYRAATMPERATEILKQQEEWMTRLGTALRAA